MAPATQAQDRYRHSRRQTLVQATLNQLVLAARPVAERDEAQPGPQVDERDSTWKNMQLFLFDLPLDW